jgi:hypothetical protein
MIIETRLCFVFVVLLFYATSGVAIGQNVQSTVSDSSHKTLEELKIQGASRSSYRSHTASFVETENTKPALDEFRKDVKPILEKVCSDCHGAVTQEGNIRIDSLDPDLLSGKDVDRWLEVMAVVSNGEMPPADGVRLSDVERTNLMDWLSIEIQKASIVRRSEKGHTSFRRMTRYEYNHTLQDIFGLPYDFAKDLPPESNSDDGFQNSSELLHMSTLQFETYRDLGLAALKKATVQGEQPEPIYWGISMKVASSEAFALQDAELESVRQKYKDSPKTVKREIDRRTKDLNLRPPGTCFKDLTTGRFAKASWDYGEARFARESTRTKPDSPAKLDHVAILPPKQKLIVELGDSLPESGTLRVRVRASRLSTEDPGVPSLQLDFGWQATNDSSASVRISKHDVVIDAAPGELKFYQWDVPLSEIHPRNSMRGVWKMGDLPSPSEYIQLVNSTVSKGDIQIDFVEVTAPWYDQWPPASHDRVFIANADRADESTYAKKVLSNFLLQTWRRTPTEEEVLQKFSLFKKIRPECSDFQQAMTEVLATILASPKFLYLAADTGERSSTSALSQEELATRLSMFLWCSGPDEELLDFATKGKLKSGDAWTQQVHRMLTDVRSRRFSEQFVRQWLGMQLLDYLNVDEKSHPDFDPSLKESMQEEPIAVFQEMLKNNDSILNFLHADYTLANERLAKHYGMDGVYGNHFRRVPLDAQTKRGGLLTQAGLLAMNSDGKDSHPLKRGIWLLKSLLNDPPPPPPPAVPVIDLADPEIAKLTLKQRIENHRNQPACLSCHAKIDPWGIAFENFDAIGNWRTQIQGQPVEASSVLLNGHKLNGLEDLKRFLLENRQDQFVRAMVHKMTTFAIGRPLTLGDRASIDKITADLRTKGDGLATMVMVITNSELFQSK